MAAGEQVSDTSHLANSLAFAAQIETSVSQLDGVPPDLEISIRFETARLLQCAGILLRLPQDLIAQSIVILDRFWIGPDGGSLLEVDSKVGLHDSTEYLGSNLANQSPGAGRCGGLTSSHHQTFSTSCHSTPN